MWSDLDESLSGSDEPDSDSDGIGNGELPDSDHGLKGDTVNQLTSIPESTAISTQKSPVLWLKTDALARWRYMGIYRALFTPTELASPAAFLESLRNHQIRPVVAPPPDQSRPSSARLNEGVSFMLCMLGGGHFAASIVSLMAHPAHAKSTDFQQNINIVAHKTFHRYTVRRKQGGAQSQSDAAKGAAHSAGSSLRRHNETALMEEIRQLLFEWKDIIGRCRLIFLRAAGNTNRRVMFGPYLGQVLAKTDPRLRSFPFTTRRATQAELMRAFRELTHMKLSEEDPAIPLVQDTRPKTPRSAVVPEASTQQQSIATPEEELLRLHTAQITALIRRAKVPALLKYLQTNSLTASFSFASSTPQQHRHAPYPLHLAASCSFPAMVLALLTKAKADPTLRNEGGHTAFDVSGDRETRDAFRVARAELGEDAWNWKDANVPSALSREEAQRRSHEEKNELQTKELERRQAELQKLSLQNNATDQDTTSKRSHVLPSPRERRLEETRDMSAEMRTKLEREKRARAAEERIKQMRKS